MKVLLFAISLLVLSGCAGPNYVVQGGGWQDACSMIGGHFNNASNGTCSF
jgi:hypothetical protein